MSSLAAVLEAASDLPAQEWADGATILIEGDSNEVVYVLVSGEVEVSRDGAVIEVQAQPGAVFGEVTALIGGQATATVRARGPVVTHVCAEPRVFLNERPGLALAIAELLAWRVDNLTRYLSDVRHQYADRTDHLGVVDTVLEALAHRQPGTPPIRSQRESEAPY